MSLRFFPCFSILACLSAISFSQSTGQTQMSAVASSQGITVLDGIRPVLTFQQAAQSKDGNGPEPTMSIRSMTWTEK